MNQTQKTLCVLGMHRSGTSCLTGIVQRCGVELGEVFESNPFNKQGNREHPRIMELNEALLRYNGGSWDQPVVVNQWSSAQVQEMESIVADLSGRGSTWWGFKDPRFLFTLPFWATAITPMYIGTLRHPMSVARSLRHRNGMELSDGLRLWYAYNRRLLGVLLQQSFPLVNFDLPAEAYLDDVVKKLLGLGLPQNRVKESVKFFTEDLRHHVMVSEGDAMPDDISGLYGQLQDYARTPC